jgi:uncharacterized protein YjiS (DUF1127 family)
MSHVAYTTNQGHGAVSLKSALSFFTTLPERFAKRAQLRSAERYLNAMDDRQLNDIGLTRGDIHDVVWGTPGTR